MVHRTPINKYNFLLRLNRRIYNKLVTIHSYMPNRTTHKSQLCHPAYDAYINSKRTKSLISQNKNENICAFFFLPFFIFLLTSFCLSYFSISFLSFDSYALVYQFDIWSKSTYDLVKCGRCLVVLYEFAKIRF